MAYLNSFVRIPLLALRQRLRPLPKLGVFAEDTLRLRVLPNDIDFNFHLNNSRFLTFMDYGRIHSLAATGMLTHAMRNRWTPLVGSIDIVYRRSLPLWTPFTLTTRNLCWDERWFYTEQTIRFKEGLASTAWIKALFRDGPANLAPQFIVDIVQPGLTSPPISESLKRWNELTREKLGSK